jgi:hypothetical protein
MSGGSPVLPGRSNSQGEGCARLYKIPVLTNPVPDFGGGPASEDAHRLTGNAGDRTEQPAPETSLTASQSGVRADFFRFAAGTSEAEVGTNLPAVRRTSMGSFPLRRTDSATLPTESAPGGGDPTLAVGKRA